MKQYQRNRWLLLSCLTLLLFILVAIQSPVVEAQPDVEIPTISSQNYRFILRSWEALGIGSPQVVHEVLYNQWTTDQPIHEKENQMGVFLERNTSFEFVVVVDEKGLYEIQFDYFVDSERTTNPIIKKEVFQGGGWKTQYSEDQAIRLPLVWEKITDEYSIDRYGDEIPIRSVIPSEWFNEISLLDPSGFVKTPMQNLLQAGENRIRITLVNAVPLLFHKITITNQQTLPTYQEYINQMNTSYPQATSGDFVEIASESFVRKSVSSIQPFTVMTAHMSRYQFNRKLLNAITISKPGEWVEYEFMIPKSGLYSMALKVEMTNIGLPVYRKIMIDGEVPFAEFNQYAFSFQKDWHNAPLTVNQEVVKLYLEEGVHTLRIESSPGLMVHTDELQAVLNDIQALSMEITSLTGGIADVNRTWNMVEYIPDIVARLEAMAAKIDSQYQALMSYSTTRAAQFNSLRIATRQLRELAKDPDLIVEKAYLLNQGTSSSANLISATLSFLSVEPMNIDRIYFFGNQTLPKPTSNFFVNLWEGIKMFFYSFFDPRYDVKPSTDPNVVKVWVRKSKLHVDLMQRMVDELFTKETGIEVELIVLQDENRLVLANAAGRTPDVALSIGGGSVFDYALRGMLADLSIYPTFQEAASAFNPNTFVPYIFEQGVYAMPETQDVALLFYRKDILNALDLDIPNDWEDVLEMLPLLQSLGMNFYHPLSGQAATKSINHMSPLIYQYGGEFYGSVADDILLRSSQTTDAVKFMIDLYNVYNLPLQVGSFYQSFRNGILPIGISDQNMYIQLKYAAPELIGLWDVAVIPGMKNDQGEIVRYDTALGSASIVFESSKNKESAWAFVEWWTSAEVQSEFSYEVISYFGDMFLYMTANIQGFRESSWPDDSKDQILQQWEFIRIPPRLPGFYMLERELSNVYNKAVFSQANYRFALDEAYFNLNREINRKLSEFGYSTSNPYLVPSNRNIHEWIGE